MGQQMTPRKSVATEDIVEAAREIAEEKPEPGSGLAVKMAYIMGQVHRIPKNGYNEFHKYAFPLEGDVSDAIRKLLSEQHIAFFPEMVDYSCEQVDTGRNKAWHVLVKMLMTFVDGDTGESKSMCWVSEALDTSDKAVNKCATAGTKFFLLKTFLISTGDDPDSGSIEIRGPAKPDHYSEKPRSEKAKALQSAAEVKGMNWQKLVDFMQENGSDVRSMTDAEADKWLHWIETREVKK